MSGYGILSDVGCVIMASGLGKRFGGNKLLADFDGKPMISHIFDNTDDIFEKRVVVTRSNDIAKLSEDRGIKTIIHEMPYRSDTVRLGIEAIGDNIKCCMFCQSDQPLLSKATVYKLAYEASMNPDFIWRLKYGDKVGSPVVFPKWAFDELRKLPDGKGGNVVIKEHTNMVKYVETQGEYELLDVDTKEDLEKLWNLHILIKTEKP